MPARLQGKLKCHLGGSQGHTRSPRRCGEVERPRPGVSQEAGQAGVWSILSLELHRGWAVCPRDEVVLREAAGLDVVLK